MYEKKCFFSEEKGKNIEFTLSYETVRIFGALTNRFKVQCIDPDDFSEFYNKLVAKEPLIRNGYVSKTENSIGLYSKSYLASVNALLSPILHSEQELTPQNFQPVFTPALNAQQHVDSLSPATNGHVNLLQSGPTAS